IRDLLQRDYYFMVYTVIQHAGEKLVSAGARLLVRLIGKTVLTYAIKQPGMLRKHYTLCIGVDRPVVLPALVLIHKRGSVPLRKSDGDIFHAVAAGVACDQELVIELPGKAVPPKTFGKLFFEDDQQYQQFIVHHPRIEHMRLS